MKEKICLIRNFLCEDHGFTLVEIIVAMSTVGLLLGIGSIFAKNITDNQEFLISNKQFYAILGNLRQVAMSQQIGFNNADITSPWIYGYGVELNRDSRTYSVFQFSKLTDTYRSSSGCSDTTPEYLAPSGHLDNVTNIFNCMNLTTFNVNTTNNVGNSSTASGKIFFLPNGTKVSVTGGATGANSLPLFIVFESVTGNIYLYQGSQANEITSGASLVIKISETTSSSYNVTVNNLFNTTNADTITTN